MCLSILAVEPADSPQAQSVDRYTTKESNQDGIAHVPDHPESVNSRSYAGRPACASPQTRRRHRNLHGTQHLGNFYLLLQDFLKIKGQMLRNLRGSWAKKSAGIPTH
ncbi:hypothetical protein Ddc_10510 [Ditylenchus destructor]|nr:hypothetical protein Ddc_10510 [Ditylenchus destructor]